MHPPWPADPPSRFQADRSVPATRRSPPAGSSSIRHRISLKMMKDFLVVVQNWVARRESTISSMWLKTVPTTDRKSSASRIAALLLGWQSIIQAAFECGDYSSCAAVHHSVSNTDTDDWAVRVDTSRLLVVRVERGQDVPQDENWFTNAPDSAWRELRKEESLVAASLNLVQARYNSGQRWAGSFWKRPF